MATNDTVIRARINGKIKNEASAVLASIGLTASDAFRLMMMRIAKEKALPFQPLIPNKETIKAIKAVRRGELTTARSRKELFEQLGSDED
ncbi:MAG: type II toxin-antitoxin system RelB/DinJ family antitoxin [Alphaproteobacteria bacterium]|nr:type II toxin-antitoxin system RelB/DinJ family antitoxin [Alphaproteobacteria bacterium]